MQPGETRRDGGPVGDSKGLDVLEAVPDLGCLRRDGAPRQGVDQSRDREVPPGAMHEPAFAVDHVEHAATVPFGNKVPGDMLRHDRASGACLADGSSTTKTRRTGSAATSEGSGSGCHGTPRLEWGVPLAVRLVRRGLSRKDSRSGGEFGQHPALSRSRCRDSRPCRQRHEHGARPYGHAH